jgi:hypothetical protein
VADEPHHGWPIGSRPLGMVVLGWGSKGEGDDDRGRIGPGARGALDESIDCRGSALAGRIRCWMRHASVCAIQANWSQEDVARNNTGAQEPYPMLGRVQFSHIAVNSSAPPQARLISSWMSSDQGTFGPMPVAGDGFSSREFTCLPRTSAISRSYSHSTTLRSRLDTTWRFGPIERSSSRSVQPLHGLRVLCRSTHGSSRGTSGRETSSR